MTVVAADMAPSMTGLTIHRVDHLDLVVEQRGWPFAEERRIDIAAHFDARRARSPQLWNGRVLLMHAHTLAERTLRGTWFETGFSDFLAWRDWGFPDRSVVNCFAMGALRAADGAFLLGVMGPHTANPGHVYFPAGTPDLDDIVEGRVDLAGSVLREVSEETGLGTGDFSPLPGWHAVATGPRIAMMRVLDAVEPADRLRRRILAYLGREDAPELADIRIVRGVADLDASMPDFVTAFLRLMWR